MAGSVPRVHQLNRQAARPRHVTQKFQRLLDRAGLPHQRPHDLRHACASLMAADGVPLLVIQAQLGHSQYFLTADTYSHLYDQTMREAAGRMDARLPTTK